MKTRTSIKLNLNDVERKQLRKNKIKIAEIPDFAPDELEAILQVPAERAQEIFALADFQRIPSVGIKFAEDLVFLGYYSVEELQGKDGAILTDAYEQKKGYRTDVCVEDQFRLAVYYANTHDSSKNWWDFTAERKVYREANGYPTERPKLNWHEMPAYSKSKA